MLTQRKLHEKCDQRLNCKENKMELQKKLELNGNHQYNANKKESSKKMGTKWKLVNKYILNHTARKFRTKSKLQGKCELITSA